MMGLVTVNVGGFSGACNSIEIGNEAKSDHFERNADVVPRRNANMRILLSLREATEERLRDLQRKGIIEPAPPTSAWMSSMEIVPKGSNDFRIVIDMRQPNKAIKRALHLLPNFKQISHLLHGSKWFSKLDLKLAFHSIGLAEETSPEIFQRIIEERLARIEGVIAYIDDILIYADSRVELKTRTEKVKQRLQENNFTINEAKCEFEKEELDFLGVSVSSEGMSVANRN